MQKPTAQHKVDIANLLFSNVASYIKCYCTDADKWPNSTSMYCDDIMHNINALNAFSTSNNVQQLHDSIVAQDTLVREHFYSVLHYIEQHNLINKQYFVCS